MYSLMGMACFFFFVAGWAFANVLDIFTEHYNHYQEDNKNGEQRTGNNRTTGLDTGTN